MPENLPTPKKSFKQLKKGNNKSIKIKQMKPKSLHFT